ncbi:MAG: hypothetical protein ACI957_003829, partial [Verrucomicrobiales bacterium]
NLVGEPSTGNLYTRFDEGRGGHAFGRVPSSTLPDSSQPFLLESKPFRPFRDSLL